ncbi:MAG: DUF4249 domain-containing protein [Crocinitomicaceae bacterium]|nr:DUF4249 domain-containing protein [Crocinitomicaceae bacterium]MBK8926303.1 DUF4249 domain-containing protein [Crocinitomicaceae bacterium]
MKLNQLKYYSIVLITLSLFSCEKVIDLELNEASPEIVVEAVLKDSPGNNYIMLSYTSAVYTDQTFDKISNADVRVTDKDGNEFVFAEDAYIPGYYHHNDFVVLPDNDYSLWIDVNGTIITSQCHSFSKPEIDSIVYSLSPFSAVTDSAYMIEYYSTDNATEVNHYRVRIFINGTEQREFYYIGNDDFINGQNYNAPFFGADAFKGDTIFIELITLDKANYTYFYTLSSNESNSTAPANPTSNLEGNAIGYFGTYTTDTMSVVIE